jgi:hypothetical protein
MSLDEARSCIIHRDVKFHRKIIVCWASYSWGFLMRTSTLFNCLRSMFQPMGSSLGCACISMQGGFLKDGIKNRTTGKVPLRFWSKWLRHIHHWVSSEACSNSRDNRSAGDGSTGRWIPSDRKFNVKIGVCTKSNSSPFVIEPTSIYTSWGPSEVYSNCRDNRFDVDGSTARGIPSDAKLESHNEGEILDIFGQSDIEIYIIRSPLKYVPSLATMASLWTELHIGEFPHMRN